MRLEEFLPMHLYLDIKHKPQYLKKIEIIVAKLERLIMYCLDCFAQKDTGYLNIPNWVLEYIIDDSTDNQIKDIYTDILVLVDNKLSLIKNQNLFTYHPCVG